MLWYPFLFYSFLFSQIIHAQSQKGEDVKNILRAKPAALNLTAQDIDQGIITDSYTDTRTQLQYVYFQQTWKAIKVYNRIMTIILRDNKIVYHSGEFVDKIGSRAGSSSPGISPVQAIFKTAQHLNLPSPSGLNRVEGKSSSPGKQLFSPAGIARQNIETELVWVINKDTSLSLSWNVNINLRSSPDWWNVRVDARTGTVIEKDNWTVGEKQTNDGVKLNRAIDHLQKTTRVTSSITAFTPPNVTNAAYYVVPFPFESPKHHALSLENEPWLKAGAGNPASTDGWHFDGSVNYGITRGNNAFAYLDIDNNNTVNSTHNWPDTSSTNAPSLTFNFTPDFTNQPGVTSNKRTAVANLFYWNNLMHDMFYQYGFDEPSGNFQADDIGRGGSGNDFVLAEGQDASGTNNANFSTPVDGQRPRMQMYVWTAIPSLTVNTPAGIAGDYFAIEGAFSTANLLKNVGPVTGDVIYYNDNVAGSTHLACAAPANVLTGKIALIDRATCNFTDKIKFAQNAGAIGVIMVNNVAGDPIIMGGDDNTITIPALMISQSDGALIAQQLSNGVNVTMTGGVDLDGDLDNGIICHEYGHGISSRLTGGPSNASCLANAEKGNEGWSDYFALMMVTNWSTASVNDGALPRTIGTYAANEEPDGGGIRLYPYSTNIAVNPLVYKNILPSEPHDLGEYWCMALWEMTWEMIKEDGINPNLFNSSATGGNSAALKLVVQGLKFQPCSPGFIDARDAILKADTLLYGAHYSCAIWRAFAKRGMGRNASQGSSNSIKDQVVDFSEGLASISAQPVNDSVCAGGTANFSVTASGSSLTYQWQVSTNGGVAFNDISGATNATLSINPVVLAMNNNQYRAVIVGACGSTATSTAAVLSTSAGPSFTQQPASQSVCSGSDVSFSITTSGVVQGYQWQESTDGGATFTNIAGATSSTLSLTAVTSSLDGHQYRSNVIASCGSGLNSNVAILTVSNNAAIASQPLNDSACIGGDASFTVVSSGNTSSYQWQVSTDGGSSFNDIAGTNSSTLSVTGVTLGMNQNQYRAVVTGTCGNATSNAGILTALDAPVITTQPSNASVCTSSDATFSVVATGPITGYQWQVSTDGGTTFTDITGATHPTYVVSSALETMAGNEYRAVIVGNCSNINSDPALLSLKALPVFTIGSTPASLCVSDSAITLSASVTGGTWSNNVQGNQFNPGAAGTGTDVVTYTVTNDVGCVQSVSASIQVNECTERHLDLSSPNSIAIYPNPNNGIFNVRIQTDLYDKLGMKVYSNDGKWIRTEMITGFILTGSFRSISPHFPGVLISYHSLLRMEVH